MNGYIISIAYTKMKEETQDHIINSQMKENIYVVDLRDAYCCTTLEIKRSRFVEPWKMVIKL
jgi:hypothetical protein